MKPWTSHIRIVVAAAALGTLLGYLAAGSQLRRTSTLIIEYGIDPREFEGVEVEIDGRIVGRLTRAGEATRTAFPVGRGEHTVRILHPTYGAAVHTVEIGAGGGSKVLVVGFGEVAGVRGVPEVAVTLR